ncbi:hypothetical protein ACHAWF_015542 [Thalassiosira exigua]
MAVLPPMGGVNIAAMAAAAARKKQRRQESEEEEDEEEDRQPSDGAAEQRREAQAKAQEEERRRKLEDSEEERRQKLEDMDRRASQLKFGMGRSAPSPAAAQRPARPQDLGRGAPSPAATQRGASSSGGAPARTPDDFADMWDVAVTPDDYIGWKGRVTRPTRRSNGRSGMRLGVPALDDDDDDDGSTTSGGSTTTDGSCDDVPCVAHDEVDCAICYRSRRRSTRRSRRTDLDMTPVTDNTRPSSAFRRDDSADDPTAEEEYDEVHAKAAEALLRVIETKHLDLDHVLSKLGYRPAPQKDKENRPDNETRADVDVYVSDDDDAASVASRTSNHSHVSNLSTVSANHRTIARNAAKLASLVTTDPYSSSDAKKDVPLKDDPEYGLYFRMLRYGFTIGAVRAALQRDGKPDVTRLDPDRPAKSQRMPRVLEPGGGVGGSSKQDALDEEVRLSQTANSATSSDNVGGTVQIKGLEFGEEGLTDRGWESALELARSKSTEANADAGSSVRRSGIKSPSYRNSGRTSGRMSRSSPLLPGRIPTPSFARRAPSESSSNDGAGSGAGQANGSGISTLPPWLRSPSERGVLEGYLRKKTRRGRWVRRWYLLDATGIYYAKAPPTVHQGRTRHTLSNYKEMKEAGKFVKLIDVRNLGAKRNRNNPHEFEIWHPSHDRAVATLRGCSPAEAARWVDAVNDTRERQRLVDEVVVGKLVSREEWAERDELASDEAGDTAGKRTAERAERLAEEHDEAVRERRRRRIVGAEGRRTPRSAEGGRKWRSRRGDEATNFAERLQTIFSESLDDDEDGTEGAAGGALSPAALHSFRKSLAAGFGSSPGGGRRARAGPGGVAPAGSDEGGGGGGFDPDDFALAEVPPSGDVGFSRRRERRNSWPPRALGSDGTLVATEGTGRGGAMEGGTGGGMEGGNGGGASREEMEAELRKIREDVERLAAPGTGGGSGGGTGNGTGDVSDGAGLGGGPGGGAGAGSGDGAGNGPGDGTGSGSGGGGSGEGSGDGSGTGSGTGTGTGNGSGEGPGDGSGGGSGSAGGGSGSAGPEASQSGAVGKVAEGGPTTDGTTAGEEKAKGEEEKKTDEPRKDEDCEPKLKDDPKYAKYYKMMSMGLPKEVARHAMTRDRLDPSILDLDPERSLKSQLKKVGDGDGDDGPPLKEDPKYLKVSSLFAESRPCGLWARFQRGAFDIVLPSQYFKMMQMGLPKEMAQHAMTRDQLDPSILDLDPEKSLKSQLKNDADEDDGPPLKEDPKYVKYFKMMQMGLPKQVAQHAMTRDQLDPSILDLDPEKSLKSQLKDDDEDEDDGPPLKEDPKYVKYFKMMKMGLPKDAAQHAMIRDQLDPKILDLDPEKSLKSQVGSEEGPPLKDNPKYAKYFKMLKMGLPMGAVKNALTRDGLDPAIMDLDHDKPVDSQLDAKKKGVLKGFSLKKKPKFRRKKVYWNKLDAKAGTVWSALRALDVNLRHDIDEFERLFSQAIDADKEREKKEANEAASKLKKGVRVIDSKRGMNGDIILKKIKLDPSQVVSLVDCMDCGKLDAVELKSLYEFMPTDEEIKGLTTYLENSKSRNEAVADMTPCEQYMVAMKDLEDSQKKFQSIIFLAEFKGKMNELKWDVDHLVTACEELRTSKKLQTLLAMILELVNKINIGDEGGAIADGFTLDSLSKLSETKAFDNKTTVLQYLVKVIRNNNKDVLQFQEDIKSVVLAKGVVMERLLAVAKQLCEDSRIVTETAAKDGDEYRKSLKEPANPKWKARDVKAQRASVKELRQMVTFLSEKDVPIGKVDTTHFERFALFSKLELQKALGVIKEANQNFIGILEYFGEDMKTQAGDFFGMIDQFMEAFDKAVDLVEKEEEAKLKEARRKLAKEARTRVKSAFKSADAADKFANTHNGANEDEAPKKTKPSWRDRPILNPKNQNQITNDDPSTPNMPSPDDPSDASPSESGGEVIAAMAAAAARRKEQQHQLPFHESPIPSESSQTSGPMNIAAMAAAAAREKEERGRSQGEDSVDSSVISQPESGGEVIAAMAAAAARRKEQQIVQTPKEEEDPSSSTISPAGGLGNIAAMAAAAARKKEKQREEETSRRLAEENARRERALEENRHKEEEARRLAEEKAKREQALAEQKQKDEEERLKAIKAGTMSVAAMAAAAAKKKSLQREQQQKQEEERRQLAEEEAKKEAERRAELLKQEENERQRELFEQKEKVRLERAEQQRRETEIEEKERLKREQEKLIREKFEAEKHQEAERRQHIAEEKVRKEKARLEREEKERLLREEKARKREEKERLLREEKERKEAARLERKRKEEELRERHEKEKREEEEALRKELERKKLEREQAKRERLERERKALEEKQRAQRAERLMRLKAESKRVELQVKKVESSETGRNSHLAEQLEKERLAKVKREKSLAEKRKKEEEAEILAELNARRQRNVVEPKRKGDARRSTDESEGQSSAKKRQNEDEVGILAELNARRERNLAEQKQRDEEARRLIAQAEGLKKRLSTKPGEAKASTKTLSSPGTRSPDIEDELMNWLSQKPIKSPSDEAKAIAPTKSNGSNSTPPPPPSKLSAAVSQAAKGRASPQNKLSTAVPGVSKERVPSKSSLSVAVSQRNTSAVVYNASKEKPPPQSSLSAAVSRVSAERTPPQSIKRSPPQSQPSSSSSASISAKNSPKTKGANINQNAPSTAVATRGTGQQKPSSSAARSNSVGKSSARPGAKSKSPPLPPSPAQSPPDEIPPTSSTESELMSWVKKKKIPSSTGIKSQH